MIVFWPLSRMIAWLEQEPDAGVLSQPFLKRMPRCPQRSRSSWSEPRPWGGPPFSLWLPFFCVTSLCLDGISWPYFNLLRNRLVFWNLKTYGWLFFPYFEILSHCFFKYSSSHLFLIFSGDLIISAGNLSPPSLLCPPSRLPCGEGGFPKGSCLEPADGFPYLYKEFTFCVCSFLSSGLFDCSFLISLTFFLSCLVTACFKVWLFRLSIALAVSPWFWGTVLSVWLASRYSAVMYPAFLFHLSCLGEVLEFFSYF